MGKTQPLSFVHGLRVGVQTMMVASLLSACGRIGYDLLPWPHADMPTQPDAGAWGAGGHDARVEPGTERTLTELLGLPPPTRVTEVGGQGTQVTVADSSGIDVGDEVLLVVQSAPGTPAGDPVGWYAVTVVDAHSGRNLTLAGTYDPRALAAIVPTRQALFVYPVGTVGVLEVAGRLTTAPWSDQGGGVLAVRADAIVIEPGGVIDVSGLGYRGGGAVPSQINANGESYDGFVGTSDGRGANGAGNALRGVGSVGFRGGGGAGAPNLSPEGDDGSGGGGGGGHGGGGGGGGGGANVNAGGGAGGLAGPLQSLPGNGGDSQGCGRGADGEAAGTDAATAHDPARTGRGGAGGGPSCGGGGGGGGGLYGSPVLAGLTMGSGGGAAGTDEDSQIRVPGGPGGGIVLLIAEEISLSGTIAARGLGGIDAAANHGGAGAGAGGSVKLVAQRVTVQGGQPVASGGPPSLPSQESGGGGAGGDGFVRIEAELVGSIQTAHSIGVSTWAPPGQ